MTDGRDTPTMRRMDSPDAGAGTGMDQVTRLRAARSTLGWSKPRLIHQMRRAADAFGMPPLPGDDSLKRMLAKSCVPRNSVGSGDGIGHRRW
jgi:hypothetical protein